MPPSLSWTSAQTRRSPCDPAHMLVLGRHVTRPAGARSYVGWRFDSQFYVGECPCALRPVSSLYSSELLPHPYHRNPPSARVWPPVWHASMTCDPNRCSPPSYKFAQSPGSACPRFRRSCTCRTQSRGKRPPSVVWSTSL